MHQIESTIGDFGQIPAAFDREFQPCPGGSRESAEKLNPFALDASASRRSEEREDQFAHGRQTALSAAQKCTGTLSEVRWRSELEAEVVRLPIDSSASASCGVVKSSAQEAGLEHRELQTLSGCCLLLTRRAQISDFIGDR